VESCVGELEAFEVLAIVSNFRVFVVGFDGAAGELLVEVGDVCV
jgi:hypothetical protein